MFVMNGHRPAQRGCDCWVQPRESQGSKQKSVAKNVVTRRTPTGYSKHWRGVSG